MAQSVSALEGRSRLLDIITNIKNTVCVRMYCIGREPPIRFSAFAEYTRLNSNSWGPEKVFELYGISS